MNLFYEIKISPARTNRCICNYSNVCVLVKRLCLTTRLVKFREKRFPLKRRLNDNIMTVDYVCSIQYLCVVMFVKTWYTSRIVKCYVLFFRRPRPGCVRFRIVIRRLQIYYLHKEQTNLTLKTNSSSTQKHGWRLITVSNAIDIDNVHNNYYGNEPNVEAYESFPFKT